MRDSINKDGGVWGGGRELCNAYVIFSFVISGITTWWEGRWMGLKQI